MASLIDDFDVRKTKEYELAKFFALIDELKRRQNEPVHKVKLLPHQKEFVKSEAKITMLIGGNRSGKTFSGVYNLVLAIHGLHPVIKLPKNAVIWIVGLDRVNHIVPILVPYLKQFLPRRLLDPAKINERDGVIKLENGMIIYLKSCDSGAGKFQSAAVDFVWIDEEPPYPIWKETYMRTIDKSSHIYITMTPINGISWSYNEIYQKADDKHIKVITANTYDNKFLPKEELERLEESLSEEEKQMRIHGNYVDMGGKRVFSDYNLEYIRNTVKNPLIVGDIVNYQFIEYPDGGLKVFNKYDPSCYYAAGFDTSEGLGDATAGVVLEYGYGKIRIAATFNKVLDIEYIAQTILSICRMYGYPLLVIERNSTGASIIDRIKYDYEGQMFFEERFNEYGSMLTKKLGFHTDKMSKVKLVVDLKTFLTHYKPELSDKEVVSQLKDYIEDNKGRFRAMMGHDDLVMALGLAVQGMMSDQFQINLKINEEQQRKLMVNNIYKKELENFFEY